MFLEKKFSRVIAGVLAAGVATVALSACSSAGDRFITELETRGFTNVVESDLDEAIYVNAGGCRGLAEFDYLGPTSVNRSSVNFSVEFTGADNELVSFSNPAGIDVILDDERLAFCADTPTSTPQPENS